MQKFFKYFLLSQILLTFYFYGHTQVGIGTSTPHASAKLEVSSTTQGFLPPRVSLTATNAASPVTSPEAGLLVYNIATNGSGATAVTPGFYYWGGVSSGWVRLTIPTDNAANVTGLVAITNGGTGATTQQTAINALSGTQASGKYLRSDGTNTTLSSLDAADITGTVAVVNGGTGASTLTGILKGNGTGAFTAAVAGTDYQAALTNPVTGTGTANYLPKLTGSTTVGNSQIFDNATSVGIGGNTPHTSAKLEVSSTNQGFLPPRMTYAQRISYLANPGSSAAGLIIFCTDCGSSGEVQLFDGTRWVNFAGGTASQSFSCGTSTVTFTYKGASVTYGTVQGANSKCWLDRNLGAQRAANSKTDHLAYGDLFQWGRGDDGHQSVSWANSQSGTGTVTTTTLSTTDNPGNANFITGSGNAYDWRTSPNDNLWQGVNGTNNVCPSGWRLPTEAELQTEIDTWTTGTSSDDKAFNSVFKLPQAGNRASNSTSTEVMAGTDAYLWTSDVPENVASALWIHPDHSIMFISQHRAYGYSVRCIKN